MKDDEIAKLFILEVVEGGIRAMPIDGPDWVLWNEREWWLPEECLAGQSVEFGQVWEYNLSQDLLGNPARPKCLESYAQGCLANVNSLWTGIDSPGKQGSFLHVNELDITDLDGMKK